MAAVFDHSTMEPVARLVLLALADHCDHEGRAWPSTDTLAHKTGLSRRTVQRCLAECELAGELMRTIGGGRGKASLYQLTLPGVDNLGKGRQSDTLFPDKGRQRDTLSSGKGRPSRRERASASAPKGDTGGARTIRNHQEPRADDYDTDVVTRVSEVRKRLHPSAESEGSAS